MWPDGDDREREPPNDQRQRTGPVPALQRSSLIWAAPADSCSLGR